MTCITKQIFDCYYHVTYAFKGKSTLCSCLLNVKELLAQNRRDISSLRNSNGIRIAVRLLLNAHSFLFGILYYSKNENHAN